VKTTRRAFCQSSAVVGAAVLTSFAPSLAFAQSPADLLQPGPLGEMVLGAENAPVTIIEYASMTCGHCADFHNRTYPKLKERYIDTGKVRFIFREFPLDRLALAASMLARCAGKDNKDRYFALIEALFHQQKDWAVRQPIPPLMQIAKQAGFTQEGFEQCLKDQKLENSLMEVRQRAAEKFKVESTPTFFINGRMQRGVMSIEDLEKQIEPHLKS
jgi:protein-disulfide isomerase